MKANLSSVRLIQRNYLEEFETFSCRVSRLKATLMKIAEKQRCYKHFLKFTSQFTIIYVISLQRTIFR